MVESTLSPTTRAEVALYGFVYDLAAQTRFSLDLPRCASLRDLLEGVVQSQGDRVRQRLLTRTGGLQPGVQVFVAGQGVRSLEERLPESPSVPIKILVLNAAAGG